jgi:hypothetical protein
MERDKNFIGERDRNHNSELEEIVKKYEEEKKRLIDEKNQHKRKISELSFKIRDADGEREMGDTQLLINSIKDLDGKEDQMHGYENGLVFLERQLKRCQLKLD